MLTNNATHYGLVSKLLHWVMAAMILGLIGVGLYMAGLDEDAPNRLQLYSLHKAMGALVMMLVIFRLVWVVVSPPPKLPAAFKKGEKILMKAVAGLLYLMMLVVPMSGYAMSTLAGYGVSFFGLFNLPVLLSKNPELAKVFGQVHEIGSYVLIALVVVHAAGAVKHRLLDKGGDTDVLKRML